MLDVFFCATGNVSFFLPLRLSVLARLLLPPLSAGLLGFTQRRKAAKNGRGETCFPLEAAIPFFLPLRLSVLARLLLPPLSAGLLGFAQKRKAAKNSPGRNMLDVLFCATGNVSFFLPLRLCALASWRDYYCLRFQRGYWVSRKGAKPLRTAGAKHA